MLLQSSLPDNNGRLAELPEIIVFEEVFIGKQADDKQQAAANNKHIREVENGEFDHAKIQKINDVIQSNPVDQITGRTTDDKGYGKIDQDVFPGLGNFQQEKNQDADKNQRNQDQNNLHVGKKTESRAGVFGVGQMKNIGNNRVGVNRSYMGKNQIF